MEISEKAFMDQHPEVQPVSLHHNRKRGENQHVDPGDMLASLVTAADKHLLTTAETSDVSLYPKDILCCPLC